MLTARRGPSFGFTSSFLADLMEKCSMLHERIFFENATMLIGFFLSW